MPSALVPVFASSPTATPSLDHDRIRSSIRLGEQNVGGVNGYERGTRRIDDFGGVCQTILCCGDTYLASPPRVKRGASVFSFTPKKRLVSEGQEMARVSRAAGYDLLILTVQKHDKFGKVWVLSALLRHLKREDLVYYEDTNTVVDEIKTSPESHKICAIHVRAPGFEEHIASFADRTVSQAEYQAEVLEK